MLRTTNTTDSSIILQSLIYVAEKDEVDGAESNGNEMNLLNPFASKKYTKADYLNSEGAKKGSGNTKKSVKTARGFDYLTFNAKKAFNQLRHAFIQAPIL